MTVFGRNLFYFAFIVVILLGLTTITNAVKNNQKSQQQQQQQQQQQRDAKCLLPMEPGPCRMSLNRFYYNAQTDTCVEFKFGGCMGNDNKFGFKQTCEEACKKSVLLPETTTTSSSTEKIQLNSKQLNPNTLKTLTSVIDGTTTTTPGPRTIATTTTSRTVVKSRPTTTVKRQPTTTQKSKIQI